MNPILIIIILLTNTLISTWNCYAIGTAWKDTMTFGGWFNKLVLRCGIIQSGIGFSMPILLALGWAAMKFLTTGDAPFLSPLDAKRVWAASLNLWYVAVIIPIIGSGIAIWAHSIRIAYMRRDLESVVGAGWNSFAQIHHTIGAIQNLGGTYGDFQGFFGKAVESKEGYGGKLVSLVILLVVFALIGGFMLTFVLVKYFALGALSRIEEVAEELTRDIGEDERFRLARSVEGKVVG